jgi:hypothetical protein
LDTIRLPLQHEHCTAESIDEGLQVHSISLGGTDGALEKEPGLCQVPGGLGYKPIGNDAPLGLMMVFGRAPCARQNRDRIRVHRMYLP